MKFNAVTDKLPPFLRRPVAWICIAVATIVVLAVILSLPQSQDTPTAYHTVKRGDFTVSVVEGGTLAAVSEVSIRSEVEGTARIISIIPEGSYVKKGDLLVELDSSQAQDQINQQQINVEKARFAVTNAMAQIDIARSTTNSDYLAAELKLKFARIDRDKYLQGQRQVERVEAKNKLIQASATMAINLDNYINSSNLFKNEYETKQKVDADGLALTNSQNSVVVATNSIWMLEAFDIPKQTDKFNSDVLQTEQELDRVITQNKRKMDQYEADLKAQLNTLKLNEDKLARDRKNLDAAKIFAPQDGLVVYQISENRFSSESLIEGGAVVRNRQELIKLPDLSRMKVTIKVHESHVNNVRPGLPAFVVLDSMPDTRFVGVVERVAPLPDTQARFGNPNLKVYNTDIYLTETLPATVKPGISAKAEIIITNIENAVSVPIQAVTTHKGRQVVYLVNGGDPTPTPVELGMFNTKFIQVAKGVKEGDRVLLSPPFDTQEKDVSGAVLAEDEKAKVARTNLAARAAAPAAGRSMTNATPAGQEARGPGQGQREGGARRGGQPTAEQIKEFDKDGDGQLSDEERQAMRDAMRARSGGGQGGPGGQGGQPGFDREAMMKQFDKNGDGELDESEREAMRAQFGRNRGSRTNGAPTSPRPESPPQDQ